MPYNLSIESEEGYIRFDLFDPFTQSEIDEAMKEVLKFRQEEKPKRILCDQRHLQEPPTGIAGYLAAVQLGEHPLVGTKIAIIRKRGDQEYLFDISAQTRGVIVEVFNDEEEAKQWLLASP